MLFWQTTRKEEWMRSITKGKSTTNLEVPTYNRMSLFHLAHIAKRQTILQADVGGGLTSSAKGVAILDM